MKNRMNARRLMSQRMYESMRDECYSRFHNRHVVKMDRDFDPIFEAEDDKKPSCKCKFDGKLVDKMNKSEKRAAKDTLRSQISDLKKQIKEAKKAGRATKAMETKLEKLQKTLDCLMGRCDNVNESVSSRFKRHSFLFESEESEENDDKENDDENDEDPNNSDDLEMIFNDYNIDEEIRNKFFSVFTGVYPLIQVITDENYESILKVSKEMRNNIRGQDIGGLG